MLPLFKSLMKLFTVVSSSSIHMNTQFTELPFKGGMHAYEVWLVPVKIILISVGHFGRQSSLLAPKTNLMQLLRPRAIVVANRADVLSAPKRCVIYVARLTYLVGGQNELLRASHIDTTTPILP